ncbi:MAG: hypothetical protein ACRYGG_00865 [Janthinobacterium lividum]
MINLTEGDIQRILFGATFLMGNTGNKWTKKAPDKENLPAYTAIYTATDKLKFSVEEGEIVYRYVSNLVAEFGYPTPSLTMYNDDPKTTFSNIKEIFNVGINRLKAR